MLEKSIDKSFVYDYKLIFIVASLLAVGLLMVASASMVVSDQKFHTPFHFLVHQMFYVGLGFVIAFYIIKLPINFWQTHGPRLLLITIGLLLLVLVPHVGREVNGSIRWIGVGPFGLQVSELAKLSFIIYLSGYLVRREVEVRSRFSGFLKPLLVLGIIGILLLSEPDFGATAVIVATAMGMIFMAGARVWQFVLLLILVVIVMALMAVASPYRVLRLTTFLHPWANQFSSGYQLTQSLIAFGRGSWFGVGLGNSIQKLFYLPEAHTDFLFAVLAEELGFVGDMVVIGLFVALCAKIMFIGKRAFVAGKQFHAYLSYGICLWFSMQTIVNIGVDAGLLPTKGLTLPFMSYGGSSMLLNCIACGIVLRIYHEINS
ncbi:MAG: putative lipid II flippase FtsW [Gammaproteobacteria bacterium]|nr:putative lipid II flippase FtsW [Gammaproteobacteria bacterium]